MVDEHHGDMEENAGSEGWKASMTCLGMSLREDRDGAITKDDLEHPETLEGSLNQWKLEMLWYIEANETTRLVTFPNATHCYGGFKVIWSPQVYIAWVDSTTKLQYHQLFTQTKSKGNPYHNIYI